MPRLFTAVVGKVVYEWEQTIDDVNVYIKAPEQLKGREVRVKFEPTSVLVVVRDVPVLQVRSHRRRPSSSRSRRNHCRRENACLPLTVWTLADGRVCVRRARRSDGSKRVTASGPSV